MSIRVNEMEVGAEAEGCGMRYGYEGLKGLGRVWEGLEGVQTRAFN